MVTAPSWAVPLCNGRCLLSYPSAHLAVVNWSQNLVDDAASIARCRLKGVIHILLPKILVSLGRGLLVVVEILGGYQREEEEEQGDHF